MPPQFLHRLPFHLRGLSILSRGCARAPALGALRRRARGSSATANDSWGTLAALEDPQVVFYNGFAYTTLASRNPYSNTFTGEQHELYSLDPAWQLCPNTCDARTVCATYPWSAYALVFADASAHWTNQASEPGVV